MILAKSIGAMVVSGALWFAVEIDFTNTVSTGVIISTVVVIAVAGLFTIRGNIAKTWRENYESEKVRREEIEADLLAEKSARFADAEEQQAIRHGLKAEVAALRLKTDLSGHEALATERHLKTVEAIQALQASIQAASERQTSVLEEIGASLNRYFDLEEQPPRA